MRLSACESSPLTEYISLFYCICSGVKCSSIFPATTSTSFPDSCSAVIYFIYYDHCCRFDLPFITHIPYIHTYIQTTVAIFIVICSTFLLYAHAIVFFTVVTIFFRRPFLPLPVNALVALPFNNGTQRKHVCPRRMLACNQIPLANIKPAQRAADIALTGSTYSFTLVIKSVTKATYQLHFRGVLTSFTEFLLVNCYSRLLVSAVGCIYYFRYYAFLITVLVVLRKNYNVYF